VQPHKLEFIRAGTTASRDGENVIKYYVVEHDYTPASIVKSTYFTVPVSLPGSQQNGNKVYTCEVDSYDDRVIDFILGLNTF
jgi:hypothetical protein